MLQKFFNPKSVALIGVSRDEQKIGHTILKNLLDSSYKGQIYLVNPEAEEILGHECLDSIKKLPKKVDLAIIIIPAQFVLEAAKECGEMQIKNLIVISAGFREIGSNGLKLEKELIEIAGKYDLKILGPNCLGILSSHDNFNASFAKNMIGQGNTAFISQSGAICSAMLDWARKEHIGFSKFVSLGNMAILNELDFLKYFITDKSTKAVFAYLENFSDGKKFIEISQKLSSKKPLIILKSGITEKGKSIALSHTGAMAEDSAIIEGILKQVNAMQCTSLGEMFNLVKLVSFLNVPQNKNIAVVGNAGGVNVLTADKISQSALMLPNFEETTSRRLQNNLSQMIHINNPLDIIGDADAKRYTYAMENILKDRNVSTLLTTLTLQTTTEPFKTAENIVNLKKKYRKNIIANFIGGADIEEAAEYLRKNNIPNFLYPEDAVSALEKFTEWQANLLKKGSSLDSYYIPDQNTEEEIKKILKGKTGMLDYLEIKNIMEILDLPLVKGVLSAEVQELNAFAQKNGYPLVMKAISPSIIHKTQENAIRLGIQNPKDLSKAFDQLMKLGGKYKTKVLTQPMISTSLELIAGAKKDNKFGSTVIFGLGGIYTEVFKDISVRVSPINNSTAMEMISEIKFSKILGSAQGEKEMDKEKIAQIILKISYLINNFPQIKEIDLNPIMIKDGKIYIVDLRVVVE